MASCAAPSSVALSIRRVAPTWDMETSNSLPTLMAFVASTPTAAAAATEPTARAFVMPRIALDAPDKALLKDLSILPAILIASSISLLLPAIYFTDFLRDLHQFKNRQGFQFGKPCLE